MKDFPLYRSAKSAVIGTLAVAGPLLIFSLTPALGLYAALLILFLLPVALCTAAMVCGLIPAAAGAGVGLAVMYRLAGAAGLRLTAVYLLPVLAAFFLIVSLRVPFWKGCGWMIGAHVAALAAVYVLLQNLAGGDLYTVAGQGAAQAIAGWEFGDDLLYQFYGMGLLNLPENLTGQMLQPVLGGYVLSPEAKEDLLLSVRTLVSTVLKALVPQVIVSQSILGGVGCLLLPLRFGYVAEEKRAFLSGKAAEGPLTKPDFPDLGMQPLSMWYLPRGKGWPVGAALALGYLLRGSGAAPAAVAGVILYAAASAVFTIQGAALVNFMQKARGVKRVWRVLVPSLLMLLSVLMFLGVFDQVTNIRGLRKPPEPKEDL